MRHTSTSILQFKVDCRWRRTVHNRHGEEKRKAAKQQIGLHKTCSLPSFLFSHSFFLGGEITRPFNNNLLSGFSTSRDLSIIALRNHHTLLDISADPTKISFLYSNMYVKLMQRARSLGRRSSNFKISAAAVRRCRWGAWGYALYCTDMYVRTPYSYSTTLQDLFCFVLFFFWSWRLWAFPIKVCVGEQRRLRELLWGNLSGRLNLANCKDRSCLLLICSYLALSYFMYLFRWAARPVTNRGFSRVASWRSVTQERLASSTAWQPCCKMRHIWICFLRVESTTEWSSSNFLKQGSSCTFGDGQEGQ